MEVTQEERTSATLAHCIGFIWLVPLIIYLTKKDQSRFVAFHALQALYFHAACLVLSIIGWTITGVLMMVFIGVLLIPVMALLQLAQIGLGIMAGLKVNKGESYEYPVVGKMARNTVGV